MKYYTGIINVDMDSSIARHGGVDMRNTNFIDLYYINKYIRKWFYFYLNNITDPVFLQLNGRTLSFNRGNGRYIGAWIKGQKQLHAVIETNDKVDYEIPDFKLIKEINQDEITPANANWRDDAKNLFPSYLKGDIRLTYRNNTVDLLGGSRNHLYDVDLTDYENPLLWVRELFEDITKQ